MKKYVLGFVCTGSLIACQILNAQSPIVAKGVQAEQKQNSETETRVSDFLGTEIVLESGDSLGQVKDLVIANSTGSIQYVIVASENNELRAIPWKSLVLYQGSDAKDRYFILGMEKDRYYKAPVIPQQEWVNFSYPTWSTHVPQVNTYYNGVIPVRPSSVRRADRRIDRATRP